MTTEQRKLVSVVFADVVGSTAFGSDNDPEAVRSVRPRRVPRRPGMVAEARQRLADAEALLATQRGERSGRIEKLRKRIAAAGAHTA